MILELTLVQAAYQDHRLGKRALLLLLLLSIGAVCRKIFKHDIVAANLFKCDRKNFLFKSAYGCQCSSGRPSTGKRCRDAQFVSPSVRPSVRDFYLLFLFLSQAVPFTVKTR
jgi:hypothetical protein